MSFRKEKKFKLSKSDYLNIKFNFLAKGMKEIFPSRIVNSCYFDSHNMRMFNESCEGILPRKKIRLRWYNSSKKINKEIKISSSEGRFKQISYYPFSTFKSIYQSKMFDNDYGIIKPILLIRYKREYFSFQGIRLTLDSDIRYQSLKNSLNRIIKEMFYVMELKASSTISDDYLLNLFNYSDSGFSKFARGIELTKI